MGKKMGKMDLSDQAMDLKFAGKQLEHQASMLEKDISKIRNEVASLIKNNNRELANIRANLLVAKQGQVNKLYKLAGQMELMATNLEISGTMMENAKEIKKLNKSLNSALSSMDTNALAKIMQDFAKCDKNLSMNTAFMGQIMGEQTAAEMDHQVAANLIAEIALEQKLTLPSAFTDIEKKEEAAANLPELPQVLVQ